MSGRSQFIDLAADPPACRAGFRLGRGRPGTSRQGCRLIHPWGSAAGPPTWVETSRGDCKLLPERLIGAPASTDGAATTYRGGHEASNSCEAREASAASAANHVP